MKGAFVVFEGVEGAGKSTQMRLLAEHLEKEGYEVLTTQEPGGSPVGEAIRMVLLNPDFKGMNFKAETLLYLSSRAHHLTEVIKPALDQGKVVICDRFVLSTLAYQGFGRNLSLAKLTELNEWVTEGLKPDLTFVLLLPIEQGLERATRHRIDRMELEGVDFHRRVQEGYQVLAKSSKNCWLVDASRGRQQIHHEIRGIVNAFLSEKVK